MKRFVYLCGLLALALGASRGAARPLAAPTPDFWGMVVRDPGYEWNTNPAYPNAVNQAFVDSMLDNLAYAGVQWVRFEFHGAWDGSDYGTINLAQADYFVAAAHARGIKVLALLGTDLLRGPQSGVTHFDGGTVSGTIPTTNPDRELSPCPPLPIGCGVNAYQRAWLERAIQVAGHYAGRIDAYELFNEENFYFALRDETQAKQDEMNPYYVAQTITKFFRILRTQASPDPTPILIGGLHPKKSAESGRTDLEYLNALYDAPSFSGYRQANGRWPADGVAYHPYPAEMVKSDNDFLHLVGPRLDAMIAAIRARDAEAKLWITEVGTRGDPASYSEMRRQADFLRQIAQIIAARQPDVGPWFWFKYEDFPATESWGVVAIPFDSQGRYDPNGTVRLFKPAYAQYRIMALDLTLDKQVWLPLVQR